MSRSKIIIVYNKTLQNIFFIVLLAFAIILTFYSKNNHYFTFDIEISKAIQGIKFPLFDLYMRIITFMGNPIPGFLMTLIITFILFYKKYKVESLYLFTSVATSVSIANILKYVVARPRPESSLVMQFNKYTSFDSFPSGHVMFYIGLFGFLFLHIHLNKIKVKPKKQFLCALITLLISIGFSRIYVGAHWFSDVVGAYVIGTIWLFALHTFLIKRKS